jgi:hypothetical protein
MIRRFSDHILTAGQAAPVLPAGAAFANLGNWIYNARFSADRRLQRMVFHHHL